MKPPSIMGVMKERALSSCICSIVSMSLLDG